MLLVKANEATASRRRVYFYLVAPSTGLPATGEVGGQPQVSTDGAAWTNTGIGTLTAIGNGHYYADLAQATIATAGHILQTRYASGTAQEASGDAVQVIGYDPTQPLTPDLGAWPLTVTVNDGSTALLGATVRFTQGALTFAGITDSSGQVVISLDSGSWVLSISKAGYHFTPQTVVVSAASAPTYSMSVVTIASSPAGTTTGYVTTYDELGAVEPSISLSATLVQLPSNATGSVYDETPFVVISDSITGVAQFANLILGATYTFVRGTSLKTYKATIPSTAGSTYALPSFIGSP
jgi:hypothetical protein